MKSIPISCLICLTLVLNHGVRTEDTEDDGTVNNYVGEAAETLSRNDWQFFEATLVHEVNGTVIGTRDEGLLVVSLFNKKSGEKMNGTVCPGNFNWYTANTFCRYLGKEHGEWDSKPNNYWRLISKTFLKQHTKESMILSELNCKDISNEADKSSDCNVTVSTDSCSSNRSVWLHCTNKADIMWNPVNTSMFIPADMDTSYLHLRTVNTVGSDDFILMMVLFYDEEGEAAGFIYILFFESVSEYKLSCQSSRTPLLTNLPAETDKHWVVEKRGYRTIIHCNGKLVVNITATSETCSNKNGNWNTIWGREVTKIEINLDGYGYQTASYYIERVWDFERASLINMVKGKKRLNDNGGLLIATVIDKQTGEAQNGTVCKDVFNWYSAQLFCLSIGHHFSDWGSYPRNMKYVPEDWLYRTDMSIVMDDVSCKKKDTDISVCDSRIVRHNCRYEDSIWLHCFSNTGCIDEIWQRSNKNCTVTNIGGFLKHLCHDESRQEYFYMCAYSNTTYNVMGTENNTLFSVSTVCENDPYVYQACGFHLKITKQKDNFCGGYYSQDKNLGVQHFVECDQNCRRNSGENSSQSSINNNRDVQCDDKCDTKYCKDESVCDGHTYGVYCATSNYIPVSSVCNRFYDSGCIQGEDDQKNCENTTLQTCLHYRRKVYFGVDKTVPIFNYTRCSVFDLSSSDTYPYCYGYLDQTNCTDVNRVGGYCLIRGFMSSVSKYVFCGSEFKLTDKPVYLCDDNLENECSSLSPDCFVHKHKLCDGVSDCEDNSDETLDICQLTTVGVFNCIRSFGGDRSMKIPIKWIMDNQTDCLNGEDEQINSQLWRNCGEKKDFTYRLVLGNKTCQDVLLCPGDSDQGYVEFDFLCDGVNSCEVENEVCQISRDFPSINTSAMNERCAGRDLCKSSDIKTGTCHIREFQGPAGSAFGVKIMLNVPNFKVSCDNLFGEYYVFISCMGLCLNSTCPLQDTVLEHNSCPGQYPDRVKTLANNNNLTFVTLSDEGEYENTFFQCRNTRCIDYSQVCDLVDDCGDMSDERNCSNHVVCEHTKNRTGVKEHLISHSQKCDGIFDCFDLSDECNLSCGREILMNRFLKLYCWLLGLLAVIFNVVMVTKVASLVKDSATGNVLCTRVLVCVIGLGDLLIGVYLIALSVFNSIILGKDYCSKQAEWLSGLSCSILGVISTTGTQLSLFSMTILSLIRMWTVLNNSLSVPIRINKRAVITKIVGIVIGIVTASLSVSIIPLIPALEDYFVQGFFYDPLYKLFIGFPNKIKHIKILQAYYKTDNLFSNATWAEIGEKVDGMFNQSLSKSAVHFYGNDGVCLFKYFVRSDDPRRSRTTSDAETDMIDVKGNMIVWLMLGVNLFCFVLITVSYLMINIKSQKSSKNSGQNNNPEAIRKNRAMQNRIALIIATDFACWVPFIIISGLHNLETIDVSNWYVTFAMIVLPLNSVINPLLYDNTLREFFDETFKHFAAALSESIISLRSLKVSSAEQTLDIAVEMEDQIVCEGASLVRANEDIVTETPI